MQKQMKCLVSCVTYDPKFLPTTQCQVGLYFLSNSFLIQAAISFSMLNFSRATFAQSIASCCISSFMSACFITAFLSAVDIINSIKQNEPTDYQQHIRKKSTKQLFFILPKKELIFNRFDQFHMIVIVFFGILIIFRVNNIKLMISYEQQRKNRPTYIQLKSALNIGQKQRKLQKLGGSIKASIQKLRRLKTDILSQANVKKLGQQLAEYEKENLYYNELQKSLVQIDEQSAKLDRIKQMNKEFIDTHRPEELQKKLEFMKNERTTHVRTQNTVQMNHINEQQLSGQIMAGNKNELRRKILEQQQEQIDQIDILVNKIHKIALDTGNMILQQGMKLQIAATTMSRVKTNLRDGRQELHQANQYQQDTNKRLITFCLLTVLIVSVVVMIIYSSSKKKTE